MEKRIYFNLALVATITAIITASVIAFLFYDIYSSNVNQGYVDLTSRFLSILPVTVGVLVFILISLYLVANILTTKIIEPISVATQSIENILSGEEMEDVEVYEELKPFLKTIQIQKIEIENYILRLKEAEKSRRDFTANVSHELKTPLTSINGFAEMLSTGGVSKEDTIKFANIIQKEGTRLLELIDSIIHLTHIEDEIESRTMETTNISHIAKEVISQLTISAKNKGLNLSLTAGDITIDANKRMIKDLLYNLVDNAIKYNKPKGRVHVSLEERKDFCIIRVKDTGIGIPEEEQNKVFERFYMVDKSRSKKVGGSGLGLSIIKHIVAYHNGRISLTSKLNEGTEIEIQLPV
ncbi:sensor histidine kinase [Clostridium sp. Cult1]|jgi:two-component system phosphate regulon sensor histidine kinase PhoR|uniref:sensor histidine kinase n=1 Tax=Clostridium sp. Cult1 TaxID=2079002 RepID=UPI001F2BCC2F|nr:HAMP domain-containing sensor histidine kinase [Clostridium sp. Cult1]MCF6463551.1 hypothetical protein [Clostridium sp. Cult1]